MKKILGLKWPVFWAFTIVVFSACKKHSSSAGTENVAASKGQRVLAREKTEDKIKIWLDNQKSQSNHEKNHKIELLKEKLDYSSLRFEALNNDKQFIVVPIKEGLSTIKMKEQENVLLITEDKSGNIKRGNIVQYSTTGQKMGKTIPVNSFFNLYNGGKIETDSKFSFLSITGKFIRELGFKRGKLHTYTIQTAKNVANRLPQQDPISPEPICTDWYWVTTYFYADGHTESTSTFAFRTCEPTSGGGSVEEDCDSKMDELEGHPVSESLGISGIKGSTTTRVKTYPWTFHKQSWGMWWFDSYEEGTHIKVNNEWIWKSLIHKNIAMSGWSIGGVVKMTILNSVPSVAKYWAGMELWYNLDGSAICEGFPIGFYRNAKNQSPIWNVND